MNEEIYENPYSEEYIDEDEEEELGEWELDKLSKFPQDATDEEIYGILRTKRGTFTEKSYLAPSHITRHEYIMSRTNEDSETQFEEYQALQSPQLIHLERTDTLDFYPEDMRKVLRLFLSYYGSGRLFVICGFRSPQIHGVSAHSVGMAIDIEAVDKSHGLRICNAAYRAGVPNIVLGGDYDEGEGYVHLDITPKERFAYNAGYYDGPWS